MATDTERNLCIMVDQYVDTSVSDPRQMSEVNAVIEKHHEMRENILAILCTKGPNLTGSEVDGVFQYILNKHDTLKEQFDHKLLTQTRDPEFQEDNKEKRKWGELEELMSRAFMRKPELKDTLSPAVKEKALRVLM